MLLAELLPDITLSFAEAEIEITGISASSHNLTKGDLFVALSGKKCHGLDFLPEVKKNGAALILSDKPYKDEVIPVVYVENLRERLGEILRCFYRNNFPQRKIAITGTNGKTSVANYIYQILAFLGVSGCLVGTNGVKASFASKVNSTLTTPDICDFYKLLSESKKNHCEDFIFEASSHALSLGRLAGISVNVAAFTNLSQDHLDFHGDFANYFAAKAKLFHDHLANEAVAVINIDDVYGQKLYAECNKVKRLTYGKDADFSYAGDFSTCSFSIKYKEEIIEFRQDILAEFELANLTCAVACLVAAGYDFRQIMSHIEKLVPANGRMQKINFKKRQASILIDFAHSPDALKQVLLALRPNCQGSLHLVFGCGGERDQEKRALMGEIADKYADNIIITDDNPRFEDPQKIRDDIIKSCLRAKSIPDRKKAIYFALDKLEKHDILLIAGKGHENYQIIAGKKEYFSDAEQVKQYIKSYVE